MGVLNIVIGKILSLEKSYQHQIAFAYSILANLIFTIANYLSRYLSINHSSFQVVQTFTIQIFIYNYIFIRKRGLTMTSKEPGINFLAILRSLNVFTGCALLFAGYPLLAYSESQVILNVGPVIAAVMAVLFLGEPYSRTLIFNIIVSLAGVLLIAKPSFLFETLTGEFYPDRNIGIILMILAAFVGGLGAVWMKRLANKMDGSVMACYSGSTLAICNGLMQLFDSSTAFSFLEWRAALANGFLEAVGNFIVNRSFTLGKASILSLAGYSRIIFGFLLDIIIDGASPDGMSIAGALCILSSIFITVSGNKEEELKKVHS